KPVHALVAGAAPAARTKPVAPAPAPSAGDDGDDAMAFSPPRRRVRAHKMSYGPVESEPAKL
ncbi:MAG TPA: hypothetical protein VHO06_12160, partial [Polyangia bacterium]|nr:hypothetical protein [Polyangia bacterium]